LLYSATQLRRPEPALGRIACEQCGGTVHVWGGLYDFVGWQPHGRDGA
jgi:hypothetical protein